jgi:hypothetical protein
MPRPALTEGAEQGAAADLRRSGKSTEAGVYDRAHNRVPVAAAIPGNRGPVPGDGSRPTLGALDGYVGTD